MNYTGVTVIGFDADDTLWVNEPLFNRIENEFTDLLSDFDIGPRISAELFATETRNLNNYGFGIKGFVLSMIETALKVSGGNVPRATIARIIDLGKQMLTEPIRLLDGVEDTLQRLRPDYRLIVVTKGDLLDQENKLRNSGLLPYFHHTEVMSDKTDEQYTRLLSHLDIRPEEFLMVGNSLKSDILPVVGLGAQAVHVPYHTTWAHEKVALEGTDHDNGYTTLDCISELVGLLGDA